MGIFSKTSKAASAAQQAPAADANIEKTALVTSGVEGQQPEACAKLSEVSVRAAAAAPSAEALSTKEVAVAEKPSKDTVLAKVEPVAVVHDVAPADLTAPNEEACVAQKPLKELVPTDADDAKETAAGAEPAAAKELAPIADPGVAEVSSKQDTPAKVADPVEKPSKAKMAAPAKSAQAKPARKGLLVRCCLFLSRKRTSKQSATSQEAIEVKPGEAIYASGRDERQLPSEKASGEIQEVVEPTIAIAAEASQMATQTTKTGEEAMTAKDNEATPAKQEQVMEPATAANLVQVVSEGNRPAEEAVHATNHEAALAKEPVPTVAEPAQILTSTNREEVDEAVHVGMFSHCCSAKPLSSTEIVVKNMA